MQGDITGNASFDGSENLEIDTELSNIAILTGTVTLEASEDSGNSYKQTIWDINYPEGFNKNNCTIISFGGKFASEGFTFGYTDIASSSVSSISGAVPKSASLTDSGIRVQAWNIAGIEKDFSYQIVLMKI